MIIDIPQDRGNRLLEGTNKALCSPGPSRREQWPHRRLTDLPGSIWEPLAEVWVGSQGHGLQQSWQLWHAGTSHFEMAITAVTPTIVWPQVSYREGTEPHPSAENLIKDLLSIPPPPHIRTRPSLPHSQSLPSGSFRKLLTLLHQRADRMKTTTTEN